VRPTPARILALGSIVALMAACGGSVSDEYERAEEPYTLETAEGEEFPRVILTPRAVERLGIETAPVGTRGPRLTVPAEAVYLDADGSVWVYTNPEPNVYVRQVVELVRETGTTAFLAAGPAPGTAVVTVGIPEIYGAETGFGT
jgi:hypothetical protein